ncbi:MAG: DNA-directed RNA polymerase subunit alpha [Parcubacteria group bacterium Gr01-1014_106]|nr:MAG: DNA-directed RNA polymerase subunit alpha [Parcubacteria group bacterium Gr01-1014_106]
MEMIPLPDNVTLAREEGNEATFEISPYFPGYGPTVGNALRRVLLSSLPGAAIIAVRCEGVEHEFSALPGVAEDFVSILLNTKRIRLKVESSEPVELRLNAQGTRTVTAGDIEKVAGVEVANPDHVIAHLTDDKAQLTITFTAQRGRGYVPVETRENEERPLGTIAVDAIFTPVERVSFRVENVRVGQITEYHKLIMTIRTDGTMTPREALSAAASILQDHFGALATDVTERLTMRRETAATEETPAMLRPSIALERGGEELRALPLSEAEERLVETAVAGAVRAPEERVRDPKLVSVVELPIGTRIQNLLEKEGIKTVAGLVQKTKSQLLGIPGLGEKALEELDESLQKLGVNLREEPPSA